MNEWKLILRLTDAIVTSICDICMLEDKMMSEVQIKVRMNAETVLRRIMRTMPNQSGNTFLND